MSDSEVNVVAKLQVQAGHEAEFLAVLGPVVEQVQAEEGCIAYAPHQGVDDPTVFFILERWESPEALAVHGKAPHMAAFGKAVREIMVARPEITVVRPVEG